LALLRKWRGGEAEDETLEVAEAVYVARFSPVRTIAMFGTPSIAPGDPTLVNECLTRYPTNLEVLAFHLDVAIYEGRTERVLQLLQQSPEAAEQDPRFWRYRGWYLAAQQRFAEAEESLRRGLEQHPMDWRSRFQLAGVLRQLGRTEEASREGKIAAIGKELHKSLFERPNARDLDEDLVDRVHNYLSQTGPEWVQRAFEARVDGHAS
jgi:tetratricopeptide (TPR) repeat protein